MTKLIQLEDTIQALTDTDDHEYNLAFDSEYLSNFNNLINEYNCQCIIHQLELY